MKIIRLKNNKRVLVDDEDYELVIKFNWHYVRGYACKNKTKKCNAAFMHRLILGLKKGDLNVDHINGNGLDNRKSNLRLCTQNQNTKNGSKHKDGSSKYKGVHLHNLTKRWRAQICVNGKVKSLGLFKTQKQAAVAYNEAAKKYHKEFAKLNII